MGGSSPIRPRIAAAAVELQRRLTEIADGKRQRNVGHDVEFDPVWDVIDRFRGDRLDAVCQPGDEGAGEVAALSAERGAGYMPSSKCGNCAVSSGAILIAWSCDSNSSASAGGRAAPAQAMLDEAVVHAGLGQQAVDTLSVVAFEDVSADRTEK